MLRIDSVTPSSTCCNFTLRSWSLNSPSVKYLLISFNTCSYSMYACLFCRIFASIFFCLKYGYINIATYKTATKAIPFFQ